MDQQTIESIRINHKVYIFPLQLLPNFEELARSTFDEFLLGYIYFLSRGFVLSSMSSITKLNAVVEWESTRVR